MTSKSLRIIATNNDGQSYLCILPNLKKGQVNEMTPAILFDEETKRWSAARPLGSFAKFMPYLTWLDEGELFGVDNLIFDELANYKRAI